MACVSDVRKCNIMCKMTLLWIIELFFLLSFLLEDVFPLKDVVLTIEPKVVQRFNSSKLRCSYDLEDQDLYTVKWYRGRFEFYRYTPSEDPSTKVFLVGGINVDVNNSNSTQVVLRDIEFNLSGNFSCEVTTDKTFYSKDDTQSMLVVQLPEYPPKISVGRESLDYGDTLRANCSSPPARPRATLKFVLNNLTVARTESLTPRQTQETAWSDLSLEMQLSKFHFNSGKLILRCVAQVVDIYHEEAVLKLTSARDPTPQRVSAFDTACSISPRTILQLVITCYVLLVLS